MVTEISNPFEQIEKIVKQNPVQQFARKADEGQALMLSDSFSPSGVGAGLGQELQPADRAGQLHQRLVSRQRLFLNMMRFEFNQRR